jgi:hypothetical protein
VEASNAESAEQGIAQEAQQREARFVERQARSASP